MEKVEESKLKVVVVIIILAIAILGAIGGTEKRELLKVRQGELHNIK